MHGQQNIKKKIVLPCLGVACYLHLESDNLLHVDSDIMGRKKNAGDITRFAEVLVDQSIWTTRYKTRPLFLLLQNWLAKIAWKLPIQQTHFLLQITYASTWTRFCHPEHGSRTYLWNVRTELYYVVYKPEEMTIIWKIGKKCENPIWQVMFTTDSSCLTSKYLIQIANCNYCILFDVCCVLTVHNILYNDPNSLSDSFRFLPLISHRNCPVRIKLTKL